LREEVVMSERSQQQPIAAAPERRLHWFEVAALLTALALLAAAPPLAAAPVAVAARDADGAGGGGAQYALIVNADDSFTHNYNVAMALASLERLGYGPRATLVLAPAPAADARAAAAAPTPWRRPATEQGLRQALDLLRERMRPGDLLLVYLTGHGYRMFGRTSLELQGGSITDRELTRRLGELPFGKLILIADQCYSGGFVKAAVALGRNVVAVSSADDRHEARCEPFIRPLWLAATAATAADGDADGNGGVSIEAAFRVAVAGLLQAGGGGHDGHVDTPQLAASGACAGHENAFSAGPLPGAAVRVAAAAAPAGAAGGEGN
jgi:hypothetical protein